MKLLSLISTFLLALCLCHIATAVPVDDPNMYWNMFNVYSLGNIGVSSSYYTSDFQGVAGVAGSAWFENFELNLLNQGGPYSLYVQNNAAIRHGTYHGGILAGGDTTLDYFTVFGDVVGGSAVRIGGWTDPDSPLAPGGTVVGSVLAGNGGELINYTITQELHNNGAMTAADGTVEGGVHNAGTLEMTRSAVTGEMENSGTAGFTHGTVTGDITNTGSLELSNMTGNQDLYNSGSVVLTDGAISGTAYNGGSLTNNGWIAGGVSPLAGPLSGYAYSGLPMPDYAAISDYFMSTSNAIADGIMADRSVTPTVESGLDDTALITIEAGSGRNVANVNAADFLNAWGVQVIGPADAVVYVNVVGLESGSFDDVVWWTSGGASLGNVVLNFPDATGTVTFEGYHAVNMLMPFADVEFLDGLVVGRLIAGNLTGGGQVNLPGAPIPEPATLLLTGLGIAGAAILRRRRRAA